MGTTLTGKRVQNTYDSLLVIDTDNLTGTPKRITDGLGNDSPIYLSTSSFGIGMSPTVQFQTSGNAQIGNNLVVGGDLTVNGTTTIIDSTIVAIGDNMIELAKDNAANIKDIGWYGTIVDSGTKYVGMYYDASSGVSTPEFYIGVGTVEPSSTAAWTVKGKLIIGDIDSTGGTFSGQITIPETPTADGHAASKKYVDDQLTAQDLDIAGDSGTGSVDLDSQTFTIAGTSNEIETSASGQTLTVGIVTNPTLSGNVNITGNLTVDDYIDIEAASGYGRIEVGGPSGGYIDLKNPFSDDFDLRILCNGGTSQINALGGTLDITSLSGIDLQYNGSTKLAVISTGIDITGNLSVSGGIKDSDGDLGTSGQILSSTGTGTNWINQDAIYTGSSERTEILVKNVQGSALVKGDPIYIVGGIGASARLEVGLCDASDSSKMPCVGLLSQNLANNGEGYAIVTGKLRNLITSPIDGVTPTENDTIYVKPGGSSGAALTTTKPTANNHLIQNVGQVGLVSTTASGNLVVSAIMRTNDVPNQIDRNVNFTDNSKLTFGDSTTPDLEIYHDTINSFIREVGTGNLYIDSDNSVNIRSYTGAESMIVATKDGSVDLYYDNSKKLETTNTGVEITGNLNVGNVYVDTTVSTSQFSASSYIVLTAAGSDSVINGIRQQNSNRYFNFQLGASGGLKSFIYDGVNPSINWLSVDTSGNATFSDNIIVTGTGSFTGQVTIPATPVASTDAASKGYVDTQVSDKVDGSGTANDVVMWLDSNTLTDAPIAISGNDATFAGNVILGDTPQIQLGTGNDAQIDHTGSHLFIDNSVGNSYLRNTSTGSIILRNSTGGDIQFDNEFAGNILFNTSNIERMRLDSSGKVIVSNSGATNIGILQLSSSVTSYFLRGGANYGYLSYHTGGYHRWFGSDGAEDMRLNSTGLGIGTTSFSNKLEVNGNIAVKTTSGNSGIKIITNNTSEAFLIMGDPDDNSMGGLAYNNSTNTLSIDCNNAERMTINSSGNVGIGETSIDAKLHLTTGSSGLINQKFESAGSAAWRIGIPASQTYFAFDNANDNLSVPKMVIDSSGRLGIRTTSPLALLNVNTGASGTTDAIIISRDTYGEAGVIKQATGGIEIHSQKNLTLGADEDGSYTGSSSNIIFKTDGSERARIDSSGRLGIGDTSPDARLHVNSGTDNLVAKFESTDTEAQVDFVDTTGTASIKTRADFRFSCGGSERMRLDSTGRLGLGTTSPNNNLQVKTASNGGGITIQRNSSSSGAFADLMFSISTSDAATPETKIRATRGASYDDTDISFITSNSEAMRIDSSGTTTMIKTSAGSSTTPLVVRNPGSTNVGTESKIFLSTVANDDRGAYISSIITDASNGNALILATNTAGSSPTEKLRITSAGAVGIGVSSSSGSRMHVKAPTGTATICVIQTGDNANNNVKAIEFRDSTFTDCGEITVNGSTNTTAYGTSSDYRLKEDYKDFNGLDIVNNIPVYDFQWKKSGTRAYGVQAHELQEALPQAVNGEKDGENYQSVDYSKIVPILLKSIQELQERIKILENK